MTFVLLVHGLSLLVGAFVVWSRPLDDTTQKLIALVLLLAAVHVFADVVALTDFGVTG